MKKKHLNFEEAVAAFSRGECISRDDPQWEGLWLVAHTKDRNADDWYIVPIERQPEDAPEDVVEAQEVVQETAPEVVAEPIVPDDPEPERFAPPKKAVEKKPKPTKKKK